MQLSVTTGGQIFLSLVTVMTPWHKPIICRRCDKRIPDASESETDETCRCGDDIEPAQCKECLPAGFHIDRKTPKCVKSVPEWSFSDAFLREMLADRTREEMGRALVLMVGRWRMQKTFPELAEETNQTEQDVRKALSVFRTEGNALWEKNQRAAIKAEKNAQLSARARELFGRGHSVREVAKIMACSVGYASELRRAA